jgi:hypothetical protein
VIVTVGQKALGAPHFSIGGPYLGRRCTSRSAFTELLAARKYAELRAKKVIAKDLDIQAQFEHATAYLFEAELRAAVGRANQENRADGRVQLDNEQCLLWDCKSVEEAVNLHDHLDGQFDGDLRKEREAGRQPLAFLVIGPGFTPQSVILAHQYKARANWDVALVTAEGLKHLAERWAAGNPEKPFPVRLLNRTDLNRQGPGRVPGELGVNANSGRCCPGRSSRHIHASGRLRNLPQDVCGCDRPPSTRPP